MAHDRVCEAKRAFNGVGHCRRIFCKLKDLWFSAIFAFFKEAKSGAVLHANIMHQAAATAICIPRITINYALTKPQITVARNEDGKTARCIAFAKATEF